MGVLSHMQDCDGHNVVGGYNKVNGIRKPAHQRATNLGFSHGELLRIFGGTVDSPIECRDETPCDAIATQIAGTAATASNR